MAIFSSHSKNRLARRLQGLTSEQEVQQAVDSRQYKIGQTQVKVRKLDREVSFDDNGKRVWGEEIVAVVDKRDKTDPGVVVTVEVRSSRLPWWGFRLHRDIPEGHRRG